MLAIRTPEISDYVTPHNASDKYIFIPGLCNNYSGSIRAHVLRNHMSKKRKTIKKKAPCQHGHRLKYLWPSPGQQLPSGAGRRGPELVIHHVSTVPSETMPSPLGGSGSRIDDRDSNEGDIFEMYCYPSPLMSLGQGRLDPFSTYATDPTSEERFLVDHYNTNTMGRYKMLKRSHFHPPRDVYFPINIEDDVAFSAMCLFSASQLASYSVLSVERACYYQSKTVRLLRKRLSDPITRLSNPTLMAVVNLIASDKEIKPKGRTLDEDAVLGVHLQGLRMLIIARGGFINLVKDPAMNWIATWMDIVNAGELSAGLTPLSCYAFDRSICGPECCHGVHREAIIPSQDDFRSLADELIGVYRDFYFAAWERTSSSYFSTLNANRASNLPVCLMLGPGTPMNRLLTDLASSIALDRVVTLLYLNITICDCERFLSAKGRGFTNRLQIGMLEQAPDIAGSLELLIWLLMTDPVDHNIAEPERLRLLTRLLRVEKYLGETTRRCLEETLLQFLIAGNDESKPFWWTPEQFRSEVMRELACLFKN